MAKTADQSQVFLYDLGGETVEVAREHRDAFLRENPKAQGVGLYDAGGETFEVADSDLDAFRKANPTAERVHLFDDPGGETIEVSRRDIGAYIGSRAAEAQKRQDDAFRASAPAREAAQKANDARAKELAKNRNPAPQPERKPEENRGNAVGRAVSAAGDVLGRVPANLEALGDRIVASPLLLAGRVADALNPDPLAGPVDVLTGQRGRFSPQEMGYAEDPYRQGVASRTADKARAWLARRDEARAPTTAAGRVADVPVQFGTTLVAYSTPVGPLAMIGNAAEAGDRAYAEGASGAAALGRTALSLGAQAAAFGPKPIPVPGANAAGRAVEGGAARIGGRLAQTPEGAARAVRTAVTAGQVARGTVESGARMAGVTAAEGGDAKDVAIAAGVGGVLGGTVRGVTTRPLARAAGEAADRMVRGGVDTPPPRMDQAGLAEGRAAAKARTPEGDAALARANAGLASPERAGLPAPAEPGAVPNVYGQRTIVPPYYGPTVSRPGEPIAPPAPYADKVPEPIPETREEVVRRRKEALDALPLPQRLKKTGFSAYYDQHPDRAGVLDAIGFENFAKLYRKYKGDFRDVTGDLVNASEVGGIVGRDYSGADGVRRALEDAAREYLGYREWKEQGAPTAEEEMQTGQEIAWNKQQNAEAEAEVRRRYELTHPEMAGEPRVTEEEIRAAQAAAEQGEVERIEAEAMQEPEPEPAPAPSPAPVAESTTPPQSANISRRYTAKPLVFQKPIVGPSGARIVSYNWTNKPVEYVDERGEDRVKRVSDWDYSNENEDTGRQIVHSFVVEMPDGTSRAVSAESAAKALGYPVGKFKTEALREIRQAMLVDSLPAEQVAGFVEALGRSTRGGARNAYPIYKQTDKVSILKDGTIRIVGNRKADGIADRWPVVITTVSPDGTIKTERLNAWPTTKGKAISADAIAKRAQAPAPVAGAATPPRDFALDGGTPAEIDAEKARAAEAQKRAALEDAAAAPGRDLGTVSIQEGLPGIGGDGTLFTPPAGGWSGRVASGPALGDAATASPSLVGDGRENPAPAVTDTLGAPREGAAQKRAREDNEAATRARAALVKWDAGDGNEAEMRRCISELEGRSLYASARDLRKAMGESVPRPGLSTAGAHEAWPAAEPGAVARVSMRDLVEAATALGNGRAPEVVKALRLLHGTALGAYRTGGGPITMRSDLWQLVDAEQRAALRSQAGEQAAEEMPGAEPPELAARAAELYDRFLDEAIRQNAQDDAPVAAQVLAHEIGHWLDDLPDDLRGRGNILGRLASLKDYLASTLFKDPRDALGRDPFLTPKEREEIAKEATKGLRRGDFPSEEAFEKAKARARKRAIDAAILERGFATAPAVRAELDDLIAWYRQSDHAPEYFRKGEEMFAEAFSAYLNYPMTARAKAPTFCDLLEHWGSKKGEIWKAVEQLHRREPVFADTQGPWRQRFKERMRAHTGAWYALESYRPKDLPGSLREAWDRAAGYALSAFSGELRWVDRYSRILEKAREGRIRANGWGTPEGARAREAVHAYTHASTRAEEEMVRFRSEVLPVVEQGGATIEDFDVYLTLRRVANELLGADKTRGAMNLPNPDGLTPAAAAAELRNWEKEQPEVYAALVRAGEIFNGIRRDTVLSLVERYGGLKKEGLDQILANDAYTRFLKLFAPSGESRRRAAQGEMRATSGIRRRELGDLAQNVSPSLATLLGDAQIMFDVSLNGARREGVALLRAAAPSAVRPARMVWNQAHHRMEPEQVNTDGWRTVVWLEDGKPVGAEVRKWAADGLRGPHSRDPSVLDPAVDFLEWAGRQNSAAVTWLSWGFNLLNPFRDRSGMLRNTPPPEDATLFVKAFGDVPAAVQSLFNGYGRMRETGEADPELLAALRAGALPGANFAGRSNRAAVAGQLQALFEAGTDPEKYRAAADEVVRSLGLDPALVRTQKRLLGALSPLLEKAARAYTWLPRHLSRTETNAKVAGYRAVKLAHPDWPDARVAEYVARNIGTPDPTAPSALAQIPGFRAFIPFYTMIYRGISDQLAGVARQQPGLMALRFAAHTAMRQMLTNPAWLLGSAIGATALGGGIVGWLRSLAKDEEGDEEDTAFYKRGLSAAADTLEWWAEAQRSVSPFDRARGYSIPLWTVDKDTKKYAYLLIPTAQELQPVDAVVDYAVDKLSRRNQYTFAALSDSVAGSTLPSAGVVPRSLLALSTGVDIGQGLQPVHRDELAGPGKHAWETAAAQWDIWTGRGWGMFPARAGAAAAWADEEKTAVERFLALPGVVNTLRPFLRVSNQGDAQTARMIDEWRERGLKQNSADAKEAAKAELRIDARFEAGKEDAAADAEDERISEEARERISETGASASELVRGARQRERDKRTLSPSERAIRRVPRRQRDEARELFGVPEPD